MRQSVDNSMLLVLLLLAVVAGTVTADLSPFFDPNPQGRDDVHNKNEDLSATPISRHLQELKAQALQRRFLSEQDTYSVDEPYVESSNDMAGIRNNNPLRGKGKGGDGAMKGQKSTKKGGRKGSKKGGKMNGRGKGKGGFKKGRASDDYGRSSPDEGGHYPASSDEGDHGNGDYDNDVEPASLEFVLSRDMVGTPDSQDNFGLASSIGLNGNVFSLIQTADGPAKGDDPIGVFKGFCIVTSVVRDELLCTYEIAFYTSGYDGLGAIIAKGPIAGAENVAIVTGAEYDFAPFSGGSLTTLQDPERPMLFAYLDLH